MKAKQRTEITYEAHETTVIRYGRGQSSVYCRQCGIYTANLSVAQASSILSVTPLEMDRSIRDGQIHTIDDAIDPMILCGNSIRLLLLGENTDGEAAKLGE